MRTRMTKPVAAAVALTLGLSLAACAGQPTNRSLESVKQPVVQRTSYTLDLDSGSGGLSIAEQHRLNNWFEAMEARYGDRISIDDPMADPATKNAVAAIAARYGLLVSEGAPVTQGALGPGKFRVVITRSKTTVPGCPDWDGRHAFNYNNGTYDGYGCAINGNLAAMVANPEHLIHGASGTGETVIMTSNKAIDMYRNQAPTGQGGLKASATSDASN